MTEQMMAKMVHAIGESNIEFIEPNIENED